MAGIAWSFSCVSFFDCSPVQFSVNEVWVAVRVNDEFIFVKGEPYDIYVLMDAASTFVFGQVLSRVDKEPSEKDVEDLFQTAWAAKKQWAKTLIVEKDSTAEDVFRIQAEKNGISVNILSVSEFEPIAGDLKELFAKSFMGNAI
ncbi:hypothetical protein QUF70_20495 [Desulfobacterales bacterium HSG17]|nr:hypothetical protein [Desulfobacterales bacterium HSG17]